MVIRKAEEITQTVMKTVAYKCDVCGKKHEGKVQPESWHTIRLNGMSFLNMNETNQVCSSGCYTVKLKEILDEKMDMEILDVDGFTPQFARELVKFIKNK